MNLVMLLSLVSPCEESLEVRYFPQVGGVLLYLALMGFLVLF